MIPVAFVRRREPDAGPAYTVPVTQRAVEPEYLGADMQRLGATIADEAPDPIRYSAFLGGRGRPVYPASQDVAFTLQPAMMLGGEGSTWDWEHLGRKQPVPVLASPGRAGRLNEPLEAHPGMGAFGERENLYRPPWESYSSLVDQRSGESDYLAGYH